MNQIDSRRWEASLQSARAASSPAADDLGYLDPKRAEADHPGFFAVLFALLSEWRRRARARRELAGVPARDLKDAGLTPEMAAHEAAQPFWRPLNAERK